MVTLIIASQNFIYVVAKNTFDTISKLEYGIFHMNWNLLVDFFATKRINEDYLAYNFFNA